MSAPLRSLGLGAWLALGSACQAPAPEPEGSAPSARASGLPSASAAPTSSANIERYLERARKGAAACRWTDDKGFDGPCPAVQEFTTEPTKGEGMARASVALLGDADPKVRRLGLLLWPAGEAEAPLEARLALIDAAAKETVPALTRRLAYTAAGMATKPPELQAPLTKLVQEGSVEKRVAALSNLLAGGEPPAWAIELLKRGLTDADKSVRVAASQGVTLIAFEQGALACDLWRGLLTDQEADVRTEARTRLVGQLDVDLMTASGELVVARKGANVKPCPEATIEAAYASLLADRDKKLVRPEDEARFLFHLLAKTEPQLRIGVPHGDDIDTRLAAIALDTKAPKPARADAARGLALRPDQNRSTLQKLAKDEDPALKKIAERATQER